MSKEGNTGAKIHCAVCGRTFDAAADKCPNCSAPASLSQPVSEPREEKREPVFVCTICGHVHEGKAAPAVPIYMDLPSVVDTFHRAHRTGRHGKFIFHTAELQPGTGRILTAQVFDVVFVGVFHGHFPFRIIVLNLCWGGGHAHVPVLVFAVQRGHGGLR